MLAFWKGCAQGHCEDALLLLVPWTRGDTKSYPTTRQSSPLSIGASEAGFNSLGEHKIPVPLPIVWIYMK